jgi:hypothetical protein
MYFHRTHCCTMRWVLQCTELIPVGQEFNGILAIDLRPRGGHDCDICTVKRIHVVYQNVGVDS